MPHRLTILDLLRIAESVLDISARELARELDLSRAESALAAPFASFAGVDFYPDPAERAAICCSRIVRNQPFPGGNTLVGYECLREMLERADVPWPRPSEDAERIRAMLERLAGREISEENFVRWVRARTEL